VSNRNRLLFINLHYWPDVAATGQNLTDLAEFLAKHDVTTTIITSRLRYQSGSHKAPFHERHNGVDIYRVPATSFGRSSNVGRLLDYATFFILSAFVIIGKIRSFDTVISLTTPPFIGTIGRFVQQFFGKTHLIWSMDLHPEAEFRLGMVQKSSLTARLLTAISRNITKHADYIVSLGKSMSKIIKERYHVDESKITEIKIWSSRNDISPRDRASCLHMLPGVFQNRFIVQYSGNMGLVHHFETFCDTIMHFREDDSVGFIFQGDGPRKKEVMSFVRDYELTNVAFLPYVDRSELSCSLAKAHVHWLSLRPEMSGMALPAKTYGYMASARPILFVGSDQSDTANDISQAGCGYIAAPGKAEKLANHIRDLQADKALRKSMGLNGHQYFLAHAEEEVCCKQWLNLLHQKDFGVKSNA